MIRFNTDKFKEHKNKGGGNEDKVLLRKSIMNFKEQFQKLYNQINQIEMNNFNKYLFSIKYDGIPPKTKRMTFGEVPETINDIFQKSIHVTDDEKNTLTNLYYEIGPIQMEWLKELLMMAININNDSEITTKNYKNLKRLLGSKVKTNSEENLWAMGIKSIEGIPKVLPFKNSRYMRILPINNIIDQLQKEGILHDNNFNKDLLQVFIDYETTQRIINEYGNIFVRDVDISAFEIDLNGFEDSAFDVKISDPANPVIVGVVDSGNNLSGDFARYVIKNEDHREFKKTSDFTHGSAVASLIIAHDELNVSSKDGLGNFNVAHFELLEPQNNGISVTFPHMMLKIDEIVKSNKDIKVWNLSLGSVKSPYTRMVSELGRLLDILSSKYDVLFVVASGNNREQHGMHSLNAPGDSINSLTVGSSKLKGKANGGISVSNFSSIGPILHFEKPEITHFGGPHNIDGSNLFCATPTVATGQMGTSFASPRVTRIAAHYISEGLTPQEAKASILTHAIKENKTVDRGSAFGYIDKINPTAEACGTIQLSNNKPQYLDFKLTDGISDISIALSHFVETNLKLGEEYSLHNIDISLTWIDSNSPEPEQENLSKKVTKLHSYDSKYANEKVLRFSKGKYFNSHLVKYDLNEIHKAKNELVKKDNFVGPAKLVIKLKKLDLFDTKNEQVIDVAFAMSLNGDFDPNDFTKENASIIEIDVDIDV